MKIINTTDNKYLGLDVVVDLDEKSILLPGGLIYYDKIIVLENGLRLINSNYIIEVQ